jgi:predicted RNA-binding Zn-ribbon protein involved in translation (DUF1610 family)
MDASVVLAAYNGLKFAKDTIAALVEGKVEIEAQTKITEALSKLGAAQDALFQLRDELFTLQGENAHLRQDIERHNTWTERLSSYELSETNGGAFVYRYKAAPEHFACPSCVNNQKIEILQDNRTLSGKFRCPGCENEYPIRPRQNPPPIQYPNY